jgi:hypothetical protein
MRREDELCKDVVFAIIRRYDYGQKKYLIARRDMEKNLGGLYELNIFLNDLLTFIVIICRLSLGRV